MKKCSTCNKTYQDENLRFCLDDGAALIDATENALTTNEPSALPPTVFSIGANQFGAGISDSPQNPFTPPADPQANFNAPANEFSNANDNFNASNPFGGEADSNAGNFSNNFGAPIPHVSYGSATALPQKSKTPLIIGGLILLLIFGGGILAIGSFFYFDGDDDDADAKSAGFYTDNSKEGQVKARMLDLFDKCQKQNYAGVNEFFYYGGQIGKSEDSERNCRTIKASLDGSSGYEFGKFFTQGSGDQEVAAWEVYFKRNTGSDGQIYAFRMFGGKYRLVDIDPIRSSAATNSAYSTPLASNLNQNMATSNLNQNMAASNLNQNSMPSDTRSLAYARQTQLGAFKMTSSEKTDYMKMYPTKIEEESLVYADASGKKVYVTKTRFPTRAEAERVTHDMIQVAKNGGGKFTETLPCYDNDNRLVGISATKIADKDGKRNYTIYYSHNQIVTFIFSLENDKDAVDAIFKASNY